MLEKITWLDFLAFGKSARRKFPVPCLLHLQGDGHPF